jgi:hypothetical protein
MSFWRSLSPLTRLLVVVAAIAIPGSYLLAPDEPSAPAAAGRPGDAVAAIPPDIDVAPKDTGFGVVPSIDRLTETVERPLFVASRRAPAPPSEPEPVVVVEAPPPPVERARLSVQGIILTPEGQRAMMRAEGKPETLMLGPGDEYGGWTIATVTPDGVTLRSPDGDETLPLFPALGTSPPRDRADGESVGYDDGRDYRVEAAEGDPEFPDRRGRNRDPNQE